MKICAYVQVQYAKAVYKNENYNTRQWIGLSLVIDSLKRNGYEMQFAGMATVHNYNIVLVSITSDCDWWGFIAERVKWQEGNYIVVVGGAGVLNVRPFLKYADCFVLGRGENLIFDIVKSIQNNMRFDNPSVIWSNQFSINNNYRIRQEGVYPHCIKLENGKEYKEQNIGCPRKCLFCSYTYSRKTTGDREYEAGTGIWVQKERSILDMVENGNIDLTYLRMTSIDGMSERIRFMVAKPIKSEHIRMLLDLMANHDLPHQLKIFNIVGFPSETVEDWHEFLNDICVVDRQYNKNKQWPIILHNTPFRAMPATPAACWPMSYKNYRGKIAQVLGKGHYKGNIFFRGNRFFAVEGMGTDSLPTVILSAICWRGTESDTENIERISLTKKFWGADTATKQLTLEKYFDVKTLFGEFYPDTLPTRNIKTHTDVEKYWGKKPWLKTQQQNK